jgi:hypothetical protein
MKMTKQQKRAKLHDRVIYMRPGVQLFGVTYFEETPLCVSDSMAVRLVQEGKATYKKTAPASVQEKKSVTRSGRMIVKLDGSTVSFGDNGETISILCDGALHAQLIAQALGDGAVSFATKIED